MKKSNGITLIALVITIIVLLILAGVSIAMLTGNNGILTQANNSKIEQSHGAVREGIALLYNEYQIQIRTGSNIKLASTEDVQVQEVTEESRITFFDFLTGENKSNIDYTKSGSDEEGYVLDVEKLTGSKQSLGNGTTEDIYKIEDDGMNYKITYYATEETLLEISAIAKEESEQGYTQADIDETLKYLDYDIEEITNDNKETLKRAYGIETDEMIGEKLAIVTSLNKDYYVKNGNEGYYKIETDKLVIPNKIEDAFVVISLRYDYRHFTQLKGPSTIIYLNDYGMFNSEESYVKLPDKEYNIKLNDNIKEIYVSENNIYYSSENGVLFNKDKTVLLLYSDFINNKSYTVPNNVIEINSSAFQTNQYLELINIPSSVKEISENYLYIENIKEINVDNNNSNYSSEDGILFNKNKTTIIQFPSKKGKESYLIPTTVNTIGNGTFLNTKLTELTIPKGVTEIEYNAFYGCPNLTITVEADSPLTKADFENTGIDLNKVIFEDEEKNEG